MLRKESEYPDTNEDTGEAENFSFRIIENPGRPPVEREAAF
jgi:hypothetical protein